MATSTPKVIREYAKDVESGWKQQLFFGDKKLRDKFVSWLVSKKLGKSGEQREHFLWCIQHALVAEAHWTADDQQSTKSNISDAKDRFNTFSSLTKELSRCLSGMSRNHGVQIDLMMALSRQDGGLTETNQKEANFLLNEGPAYFDRLSSAAETAVSNLKGSPGPATFFDHLVLYIGMAWQNCFDVKPSCSTNAKFRQFILLLNEEIDTCLPTSSSSLRRALKQ